MSKKRPDVSGSDVTTLTADLDPTGVPNLDRVLGGGLPRGALVIVAGPPGSGKTTLANQMAFAAANSGRRAMILTALSEPTSKLINHLRSFTFFNEDLIGETVQFLSLQQFLAQGLASTSEEMIAAAHQFRANFVVLDGFRGVRGADVDPQAAREFLYDVGTTLSVFGATTIITSEADPRDPSFFPEATTADVIIGLHYGLNGVRHQRAIEAIKMRGASPLAGLHGLGLSQDGAVVFPRLEARVAALNRPEPADNLLSNIAISTQIEDQRAQFGIPELDDLLGGGLSRNTSTLLVGSLGTGKTFLALQFALAGALAGDPTLYVGFRETVQQLLLKTAPFGLNAQMRRALGPGGNLALLRLAPVELEPDTLADQLLEIIDRRHIRRLAMDSLAELEHAALATGGPARVSDYMAALIEALRARGVTALYTKEIRQQDAELDFSDSPISVLAENVINVRQIELRGQLYRLLAVLKMRFSSHDTSTLREFTIKAPQGIVITPATETNPVIVQDLGGSSISPRRGGRGRTRGMRSAGEAGESDDATPEGTL